MEQQANGEPQREPAAEGHEVAGSATLHLKVEHRGPACLVLLNGELDLASAPPLREVLAGLLGEDRPERLVLDLSDLLYVDSTGLSVFVSAHKRAAATGVEFSLINPNSSVRKLFQITALDQVFDIQASVQPPETGAADPSPADDRGSVGPL